MAETLISVPRCTDGLVVSLFAALVEEVKFHPMKCHVTGADETISVESTPGIIEFIKEDNKYFISEAWAHIDSARHNSAITIRYHRGEYRRVGSGMIKTPSLRFDTIEISPNRLDSQTSLQIMAIIDRKIISHAAPISNFGAEDSELNSLVLTHHQLITSLREQLASVTDEFTRARLSFEAEMIERGRNLADEFDKKRSKLEEEYQSRVDELASSRADIERRAKELDDRHNTHARRQLRQDMKDRLSTYKEKFQLTQGTRRLRWPITVAVVVIELVCLMLLVFLFTETPQGADVWDRLAFWVKSIGVSFFGIGTAVWYLKWLTLWSTRHADAEFQLRQLELDIDRASWVVETAFEWKSSQESAIPQSLLDAMSRNLFAAGDSRSDNADSPADHLASALLGDASKLRLKLGDQELELDRAALKRAKKPR